MKEILVTGGQGMMGQYFSAFLGDAAFCPGRDELDVGDIPKCREYIQRYRIQAVINCAGDAHGQKRSLYDINAFFPGAMADMCGELDIPLVFLSSSRLFDGVKQAPYFETDCPNPVDDYGLAKYLGEKLVENTLYKKRFFVFRMAMVLGWRERHPEGQLVTRLLREYTPGCTFRLADDVLTSAVHAADVAAGVSRVLNGKYSPGIYHLCNNESASPFEIMNRVVEKLGISAHIEPAKAEEFTGKFRIPGYSALQSTRLPLLPGWKSAVDRFVTDHQCRRVSSEFENSSG